MRLPSSAGTTNMTHRRLRAGFLGRVSYEDGLRLQEDAAGRLRKGPPGEESETLLLLEHPPVVTLGKNASDTEIIAPPEQLESRGVAVFRCDRGGKATFHGPGQLVGYPVLNLKPDRCDVGRFVADLEETIIRLLALHGISGGRFPGYTGVWVDLASPGERPAMLAGDGRLRTREGRAGAPAPPPPTIRKIAAIGVHLARWITTHGFCLNVHPDLSFYDLIVPCGIRDFGVTSLAEILGREISVEVIAASYVSIFCERFQRTAIPFDDWPVRALESPANRFAPAAAS